MSVAYPKCLYIRIERDLRDALQREVMTAGVSVSELARRALSAGLVAIRPYSAALCNDPRPLSTPAASMRTAA